MLFYLFCMFDDYWRINHQSRNSAGKASSRHQYYKDQLLTKNIPKLLLSQMTEGAKRGGQGWDPGAHTMWWRGPPPDAPPRGVASLAHHGRSPFAYVIPRNPKTRKSIHEKFRRLHGAETREREKLSRGRNLLGKFLPREGRPSPSLPSSGWSSLGSSSSSPSPTPSSPPLHFILL